nr:MAG TPA: hypothetical protein [Caudoviricetes sp.]
MVRHPAGAGEAHQERRAHSAAAAQRVVDVPCPRGWAGRVHHAPHKSRGGGGGVRHQAWLEAAGKDLRQHDAGGGICKLY